MPAHDAVLEFEYESRSRATAVAESVAREIGEIDDGRSRTTLSTEGKRLRLVVEADDVVAFRAALNTWCTLLDVAETSADLGVRFGST